MPVAACIRLAWVRGLVELRGQHRLSDLLNNAALGYLTLIEGEMLPFGPRDWPRTQPRLYLNKADFLFAHATAQGRQHPSRPGLIAPRAPVGVGLYVGDYHIQGTLHLVDRVPWEQYLSVGRERFLALTYATITRTVGGDEVVRADFTAVNREHVSVLYEAE